MQVTKTLRLSNSNLQHQNFSKSFVCSAINNSADLKIVFLSLTERNKSSMMTIVQPFIVNDQIMHELQLNMW